MRAERTGRSGAGGLAAAVLLGLVAGCARGDEAWLEELESADPFARAVAALALSVQAPERGQAAVEVLLETVDRSDLGLEREAAAGLARVAPWATEPLVTALLTDAFATRERHAALQAALAASGARGAQTIVAALRGGGSATDAEAMGQLGVVLVRIGPAAVPALSELLAEDREPRLTGFTAFVLGQVGPAANQALPALRGAREHPDPAVRAAVEEALRSIEAGGAAGSSRDEVRGG